MGLISPGDQERLREDLAAMTRPVRLLFFTQALDCETLASVDKPVTMHVFTTPTCPHCPRPVNLAHEMAWANRHITSYAVEITEYPDLARRFHVTGVPKTVVDDTIEILGALPEDDFISQSLAGFPAELRHEDSKVTKGAQGNH